jgi:small multidrug resistance pump/quaternary ammonium compound-resistance protein SugE
VNLLLSVLAAGAYTVGGVFMRKAEGFAHALPAAMVFVCFCAGAALQTLAMRRSEVSINYILVLGLEAALAVLLGVAWLGEALSPRKLASLALILAGVMSLRLEEEQEPATPAETVACAVPAGSLAAPGAAPGQVASTQTTCRW